MKILAIDPGNIESGYCILNEKYEILEFGKIPNEALLLKTIDADFLAIEMIRSYGMSVGQTVFDTCVWIGRFIERYQLPYEYVYRADEKMNICKSMKANDSTIRQALIDRFAKFDFKNGKGTKKNPDFFYGFSKDMWSAFAVGITYIDRNGYGE